MPLAYIEGFTYFYGRKFTLTPDVLIPRPETAQLVDLAIQLITNLPDQKNPLRILDLGTGSGIIAITLALELKKSTNLQITATDICPKTLKIARENAHTHKVSDKITFIQSDLFNHQSFSKTKFSSILANLPYVDPNWPWLNHPALAHEPPIALFAKDHGLALIKQLIRTAKNHLDKHGTLILEHDPCEFPSLSTFANQHHFTIKPHTPYITALSQ